MDSNSPHCLKRRNNTQKKNITEGGNSFTFEFPDIFPPTLFPFTRQLFIYFAGRRQVKVKQGSKATCCQTCPPLLHGAASSTWKLCQARGIQRHKQEQAKHQEKESLGNCWAWSASCLLPGPDTEMGRGASAKRNNICKGSMWIFWVCEAFSNLKSCSLQKGAFLSTPLAAAITSSAASATINLATTQLMLQFWSGRR